jgi:RNA-splicing ligase RtcB
MEGREAIEAIATLLGSTLDEARVYCERIRSAAPRGRAVLSAAIHGALRELSSQAAVTAVAERAIALTQNRLAEAPRINETPQSRRKAAKQAAARRQAERNAAAHAVEKARRTAEKEADARRLAQARIAARQNNRRHLASVREAKADGRLKPASMHSVSGGRSESNRRKH